MSGRFEALASGLGHSKGWLALAGSLLLHLLLFAIASESPDQPVALATTEIEVTFVDHPNPVARAAPAASGAAVVPAPSRTQEAQRSTVPTAPRATAAADLPDAKEAPASEPTAPPAAPALPLPEPRPARVDLSPRAAALTLRDALPEESAAGCRAREPDASAAQCVAPRAEEATAAQRLQRTLQDAAAHTPGREGRRPPELKRKLDGSYEYEGHVFLARIRRDGTVEFEDRENEVTLKDGKPTLIFDFDDVVQKHVLGKPLYPAEKRWFLEQTAEFREALASADLTQRLEHGALRIRGQLLAIVDDPQRSAAAKRRAVFALWDDCADDEIGRKGQALVEAFVREHMPAESELGFRAAELDVLNAQRVSPRRFDPYRAVTDGGAPG